MYRRSHVVLLFALSFLITAISCDGASRREEAGAELLALSLENIYTVNHGTRQAAISPGGDWVAVTAASAADSGIFRVSTRQPASDPDFWVEGSFPVWCADGTSIVFRRDGDLWAVSVGSSEARRITTDDEDERAARPSPDGTTIAFLSGRGGFQDVWLVPSDGSAAPRQLTAGAMAPDDRRFAPAWSPDGTRIAYFSNKADYWADDIWIVEVDSGLTWQLSRGLMASSTPVWSPDGSRIALLGTAKDEYWYEDLAYLYVLDPTQRTERVVEMQVYGTDWLHNHTVHWSGDGEEIFFPHLERGAFDLWRVAVGGGVATRVTSMGGALAAWDASADGTDFVFVRSTSTRGNDVDYASALGGPVTRLTHFAPRWDHQQQPEEIYYRSWDGLYIQGFLYRPPGMQPGREYPALVNVHGGGTNSYLQGQNLTEQYLASKGYVVLAVNYRGGSGFGREFQDLGVNDWANGQARDAAHAATFIRAQPWSSGKVGIYGYSYGGITTMAAIARVPDAFDAAVPMAGIYDFGDALTNADRLGKIFIKTGHSGTPAQQPETYARTNTLARLPQIRTPLLVMHGEADVRAPFRQYELAVGLLKENGQEFESHSYPGEPHGFRNPANRIDMYTRLEAFFDARLRR